MSEESEQLDALISAACDGRATPHELSRLRERLATSEAARDRYLAYVDLHAMLTDPSISGHARGGGSSGMLRRPSVGGLRWWIAAAAIVLACGIVLGLLRFGSRSKASSAYARITLDLDSDLKLDGHLIDTSGPLPGGEMTMTRGVVQLVYGEGVNVVIEAPSRFKCESAKRLTMYEGRLTGHVSGAGVGFTVSTPGSDITDLGTEFGVDVASGGQSQVHVFEGKVEARAHTALSGKDAPGAAEELAVGRAAGMTDGAFHPTNFRNAAFVHALELPALESGLRQGQPVKWQQSIDRLRKDPALVAMFVFDKTGDGTHIEHGGRIHGARWVQGRFPGKDALDFSGNDDYVELDDMGSHRQLTMMAWVRLDYVPNGINSIYHTNSWETPGQVHWMVLQGHQMRFALHPPGVNTTGIWPESKGSIIGEQGRWVHLAVTYDTDRRKIRFFVNGKFDSEVAEMSGVPAVLGAARIGNWDREDNLGNRRLSGRLDQLVFLSRTLSDDEIRHDFETGTPYAQGKFTQVTSALGIVR